MIFIQYEPMTDTRAFITRQHHKPIDPKDGIRKADGTACTTQEEVLWLFPTNSAFVDVIPNEATPDGYETTGCYYNPQTKEIWHEYGLRPLTPDEEKEKRISDLELAMAQLLGM